MRELGTHYEAIRGRIVDLVGGLEDAASIPVPTCPGWSVHSVVSHLTGNCTDVLSGNIEGVATAPWTAAQVDERKDRSTAEVLAEWNEVGPAFAALIDDFPGYYGRMPLGDITAHEHDLRAALDAPGERDSEAVAIATEFLVAIYLHPALTALGLGPLEVRAGGSHWVAGTGEAPTGDLDAWKAALATSGIPPTNGSAPVGTVEADRFELFRAISGRRSTAQIRDLKWSVDPDPYVPAFAFGPFRIPSEDIDE